jgi:RimK family alpha-L-glutamate ligase
VGHKPFFRITDTTVAEELDSLIVRPVGRGSLEELIFRMDVLYRLQRLGVYVVNPPEAIEHCVDKYDVLAMLEENGIAVPRTTVTESVDEALKAFDELGRDVVVKPLFGSRGLGSTRIRDADIAYTVFRAIAFYRGVIYIQEFVPHGSSDIRAFVIGDSVAAAMRRVAQGWKTNYSQGAQPQAIELDKALEDLAVKSAELVGCKVAGVDILESPSGPMLVEVNSQPGWKGLQSITKASIADGIVEFILSELKK